MRPTVAFSVVTTYFLLIASFASAQNPPAKYLEVVQQTQTVRIPVHVYSEVRTFAASLTAADFHLTVEGKPATFQLGRPWDSTKDPKTGKAVDRPNLLILLPLGNPIRRSDAIGEAVRYFDDAKTFDWNVSIMDDVGQQSAYSDNLQQIRKDMHAVASEDPDYRGLDIPSWRRQASLAVESMRELPGRRVVVSLGDVFHWRVYNGFRASDTFEARDLARAARSAGALIYAAESYPDLKMFQGLSPHYQVLGDGPWMVINEQNQLVGWVTNYFSDTIDWIRQEQDAAYVLEWTLTPQQMDGKIHKISIHMTNPKVLLSAPTSFVAPNLRQLTLLADAPAPLRAALLHPVESSSLEMAPRMDYFPHANGHAGTQLVVVGFLWNKPSPPPAELHVLAQWIRIDNGVSDEIVLTTLPWNTNETDWQFAADVAPGSYLLRVAAGDDGGKVVASAAYPFTVDPTKDEPVLISSLVVGKNCEFVPPAGSTAPQSITRPTDLLMAGRCWIRPDPTGYFSPQQVLWTMVRITPIGEFSAKPPSSWKGRFTLRDDNGKIKAEQPVRWMDPTMDSSKGSYVASAVFPMANIKLKDGGYSVVLELKGPGIDKDFYEESPITAYGFDLHSSARLQQHR